MLLYRQKIDYTRLIKNASRDRYVQIVKNMGIDDICECGEFKHYGRRREGSGLNGLLECSECHYLKYPLSYMYMCDECTEPALSEVNPLRADIKFYCEDCLLA